MFTFQNEIQFVCGNGEIRLQVSPDAFPRTAGFFGERGEAGEGFGGVASAPGAPGRPLAFLQVGQDLLGVLDCQILVVIIVDLQN